MSKAPALAIAGEELDQDANAPEGWALTVLDEAGHWMTGGTPSRKISQYFKGTIPWVKSGDLNDGIVTGTEEKITKEGLQNSAAKLLPVGTISIALYGATIGKLGLLEIEAATNQACANCVVDLNLVDRKYLFFYLLHERQSLIDAGQGGAQPNLTNRIVRDWPFRLAPLSEQRRIASTIDALLALVNKSKARLTDAEKLLKAFRQSVLATACSGLLTKEWRENEGGLMRDDSTDLPAGWRLATIGEVIEGLKYGTAQKCSYDKRGVPVIRIPNIEQGVVTHSDLKYAELPPKELQQLRLVPGDILLIRSNGSVSLVGKSALVRQQEKGFAYAGYLIRLRPDASLVLPEFLNLCLGTYQTRLQIEMPARSTSGVHNINGEEVRALGFSLPPVPEQHEIVRRVEALLKLAEKIEERVAVATKRADKLTQAILAKAFIGELVPTEAELALKEGRDYEPASVLLEKIKSEREKAAASRSGAPKPVRS